MIKLLFDKKSGLSSLKMIKPDVLLRKHKSRATLREGALINKKITFFIFPFILKCFYISLSLAKLFQLLGFH